VSIIVVVMVREVVVVGRRGLGLRSKRGGG